MKNKILLAISIILITIPLSGCKNEIVLSGNYETGLRYKEERLYTNAILSFEKALEENPQLSNAYLEIANIYDLKGLYEKALETLEIGIENSNEKGELYFEKAQILFKMQDYEDAIDNYNKALKHGYNSDNALIKKGQSFIKLEKFQEAITELENISKNSDYFEEANYYLSVLETDNYSKALAYIELVKKTTNNEIKSNATTFKDLLLEITEKDSDSETNKNYIKLLHGYALIKIEQFEIAKKVILPVARFYEEEGKPSYQANFYLGSIYYHLKDYEAAKNELMTSIVANPTDPITLHLLGLTYSRLNEQAKSLESFEKSIMLEPENERSRSDYIKTLIKFKINSKAESNYEELIKMDTQKKPQYQLEFARFLNDIQNNPEKSLSISSQLINEWDGFETTPDEIKSSIYDVHGWGYYLNNQYDKAEEYLTKSIETNSFSASAFYHLAVVMEKTENYKTAIDYYTKAIDYAFDEEISNKANQGYQNLTK